MSFTLFLLRSFFSELEFDIVNLIPYLISSIIGIILGYVYFNFFSRRIINNRFVYVYFPAFTLFLITGYTGLSGFWLFEDLIFMLSFMVCCQELVKSNQKSL